MWEIYAYQNSDSLFGIFNAAAAIHASSDYMAAVAAVAFCGFVAALIAYHAALTSGDIKAPERFVLADERFLMIEGKHFNQGWTDYRDNHLKAELADLAKVRFRLSILGIQVDGDLATVSFMFNVLPKSGPEMDFGGGRASASLVRAGDGWKLQQLHTS